METDGRATKAGPRELVSVHAARRAELAEERLRHQTLLFAEAEHKLKTALAIISGWASTLDDRWDNLSPEQRREGPRHRCCCRHRPRRRCCQCSG